METETTKEVLMSYEEYAHYIGVNHQTIRRRASKNPETLNITREHGVPRIKCVVPISYESPTKNK